MIAEIAETNIRLTVIEILIPPPSINSFQVSVIKTATRVANTGYQMASTNFSVEPSKIVEQLEVIQFVFPVLFIIKIVRVMCWYKNWNCIILVKKY